MQNEFANRQNMHLTILKLLEDFTYQPAWKNQSPVIFTRLAADLIPLVNGLTDLIAGQQTATTGYATDKEREEMELENAAHDIAQALAGWYEDQGQLGDAAQIDLALSSWQRLRDTELIAKSRLLLQKLTAALATDAAALVNYGLDAADATLLAKELADYEAIIANPSANPSAAIFRRRALTVTLRPQFRAVSDLLAKMDRHVLRLRRTEAGATFATVWDTSRIVRDLGTSATPAPAKPTA